MAELHVQIDKNDIDYKILASDGDCQRPRTHKAKINPSIIGSFGEIKAKDYTLYTHGIIGYYETNKSTLVKEFSLTSEEDLLIELIIHISNIKIELIDKDNYKVYLTYSKDDCDRKRDIDVYFNKEDKEPYDIPILFKYGDKFFAPKDNNSYFIRWNEIKESEKYNQSNPDALNDYINGVYNKLTEVDISQTSDYGILFNGKRIFESNDNKFSTKRFTVSKDENLGKNYKTVTHKHCSVDSVQHKPRIGNLCSFNGCKFDNNHINVVKNNDTINEVVVFFPKDDSDYKDPKLVLLNEYSKTYGSTTYGYYNLYETQDPCKGYEFKHFQNGCRFNLILADEESICPDVTNLRQLISKIPQKHTSLITQDLDDCKCSGPPVEVQTTHLGGDGYNGEAGEETELIDEGTASEFSKKPVSLSHKITLKRGANPPNTYQPIDRATKILSDYSRFIYTVKTITIRPGQIGPWNLYADTFFRLGKKTESCGSSGQPGSSRCEFIKFKVSDTIFISFYEREFYSIDVFFHTQNNLALLIQFFNGSLEHIIRTSSNDDTGWKKLDEPLRYSNGRELLKWLKQIKFNIDTFVLLIDKVTSYKTTAIQQAIKKWNRILDVSPHQSSSISVNSVNLFKKNYKQCVHTINTASGSVSESSYPLRLFMSDGSEVELYDSSAKRKEKLEYTCGLGQNKMEVYLVKSSSNLIPVLIRYNSKVYQPKIEDKKPFETNKWVHIPNGSNLLSSVRNQENNPMLRKKLCILKEQVSETNKHLSASEILKHSPEKVSQVQTNSTSQPGTELQSTQDLSESPNHKVQHSRSNNHDRLPDVQQTVGSPSHTAPSHPASPQASSLEHSPEQSSGGSSDSGQVQEGGPGLSVDKGETGKGQQLEHQQDTEIKASGHSNGSPTDKETPGAEGPEGSMGDTGVVSPSDSVSEGTGIAPGTPKQPGPDGQRTESAQELGSSSAVSVASGNSGGDNSTEDVFQKIAKYAQENPGIFYGSTGGSVAGVGVIGTAGAVIYKKCIVGSAVAAGKAAAKVGASAASAM